MTNLVATTAIEPSPTRFRDVGFAAGIICILCFFFLPLPAVVIDLALAFSIALSVLILMVALWIQKPLEFSSFPTILLVATLLRLALNVATTRLILTHGAEGVTAAGFIIGGFSNIVMGNDFMIGLVVFMILVTVNFLVITKGATRIAEVGARFTLDAMPGKQMAIDADLSAGIIDEKEAQKRRRELEEESAFFGSMDGASKFVRGDAIAGLIILAVNVVGGIILGVARHGMPLADATDVFTKLSVGDGLVSQIPALIVSLAAGLLVSKGGTTGAAEQAVVGQLSSYPRAMLVAALLLLVLSVVPGLPFLPFAILAGILVAVSYSILRTRSATAANTAMIEAAERAREGQDERSMLKDDLRAPEIELCLGKQIAPTIYASHGELSHRVAKMRRKFAQQYGFVVPEIKLSDNVNCPPTSYQVRLHGVTIATQQVRVGEILVVLGDGKTPDFPGDEVKEPAFGMRAMWVPESLAMEMRAQGFTPIDILSVILTHLSEVIRNNLSQLLSYKDMRQLLDRLDPEYKRLIDDMIPAHISHSGLQAVLKLLLSERVSIRNIGLVLEAVAEIAPHVRRSEQVVEHVRMRMAQQICGDLADGGVLKVLRLGGRWELVFHQSLKRDAKGEVVEFDIDPRMLEQFGAEVTKAVQERMSTGDQFAIVAAADARPYVRMVVERLFPSLPVLSNLELARGIEIRSLGSVS
ncbi:MAG: flagellar biosynthesis protein FlhA [Beijerinckiaceae bacterium]